MAAKEVGVVKNSSGYDRKVKWDQSTGEVWVEYHMGGFFSSWEWRSSKMRARTIDQVYEIARGILDT